MNFFKKYKIYIVIFIFSLMIMLISSLYETNIFYMIKEYIFNPEYKANYASNSEVPINFDINLFNIIKFELSQYHWTYDYLVIWGTNLFQLLIPIIAAISALLFYTKNQTINKFAVNKNKNYKKFLLKEATIISFKIAFSIFMAFIVFYISSIILSNGATNSNISRNFLLDILGTDFYYNNTKLYYFIDGFFRLFMIPFIYSIFACSISMYLKNVKQVFLAPIVYYFGLTLISYALTNITNLGIYLSPLLAMVTGAYANINSLCVMIMPLLSIIISLGAILWRGKYVEI